MPTKRSAKRPIKAEDLYDLQFVEDPQISPDGKHIAFVKVTIDKIGNKYNRSIWLATLGSGGPRTRQYTGGPKESSPRWSPDGQTLAFVSARSGKPQVYLIGLDGGEGRAITSMPNGATSPAWSPDGRQIAFLGRVNAEERKNEDSGREDPPPGTALEARHRDEIKEDQDKNKADPRIITRLMYRTGTEFLSDRFGHIYVTDVPDEGEKKKPYRITDGDLEFPFIEWSASGKYIYSVQPRRPDIHAWSQADVIRINATGNRRPFTRLTGPGHEYLAVKPSPDGKWLAVVQHTEDGSWGKVAVVGIMPAGGGPVKPISAEFDRSIDDFAWAADSKSLYLLASDHGSTAVYRIGLRGGAPEPLMREGRMVLGFSVAQSGDLAFVAGTPLSPSNLYHSRRGGGKSEKQITNFNAKKLAGIAIARTDEIRFNAPDGREIQGWLLKPAGFKKGRKYPMAVNMHGGPHVMWGPSMPGMWMEWQVHAARGYVVFYCNPRGSDGYGSEFATTIQSRWGDEVMKDVLAGVETVVDKGYVDEKRMALTGGSYAGYMTAWIVGRDHRFACAWSQRGLYNLISFYGATDIPQLLEREWDLEFPGDDLEKSWRNSPLAYARSIRTPLAIEHQENDYRCPISEAEQLFTALKRLGREVVFYRYPREGHEMSRSGEPLHRVDRLNRMVEWFDKYCKGKK